MLRSILLLIFATMLASTYGLEGKILSCAGWKLNRHPHVKKFLLEFEAEEYRNVEVEYIRGRTAVLYISDDDGNEIEQVELFDITTNEGLHEMMINKGFERMSDPEIADMRAKREKEAAEEEAKNMKLREERREARSRKLKEDRLKEMDKKEIKEPDHYINEERERRAHKHDEM